jgi:hypothetical protein
VWLTAQIVVTANPFIRFLPYSRYSFRGSTTPGELAHCPIPVNKPLIYLVKMGSRRGVDREFSSARPEKAGQVKHQALRAIVLRRA